MPCSRIKFEVLATTALCFGIVSPAVAQEGAGAKDNEDIIVTAQRFEQRLQDVPISITVYNQEQVSNRNIFNAADLAVYTPSLSSNSRYGPEKASFAIRGFVQDFNTAPSVGVYFADVVAPDSAGSTTSGNGVGVGNMFDLQNVQVLKGPQGTLFGRNTTGGAVLLVPQKPTDKLEGYVEGSLGNYDMNRVQAVLNVPLADTFKVRLGVDRMKRDGYEKNHSGIGPDRFADTNYVSARLSILANLTPDLENYTVATFSRSDTNGSIPRICDCMTPADIGAIVAGIPDPDAAMQTAQALGVGAYYGCAQMQRQDDRGDGLWDVENSHPNPNLLIRQWQVINTTTWQASDTLTIKNIASYGEFREGLRQSLTGDNFLDPENPNAAMPDFSFVNFDYEPGLGGSRQSTFTEELQVRGVTGDGRLNWQAGGYMEISNPIGYAGIFSPIMLFCLDYMSLQCAGEGNISSTRVKTWNRDYGLYAQATYDFTDQLSLTGGLRYTWDSSKQYYAAQAILFPAPFNPLHICAMTPRIHNPDDSPVVVAANDYETCAETRTAKSHKPTWVIDLDYKPNQNILLYAKWARGYRKGGVMNSNPFFETWGPEKVDMYEVGGKTSFAGAVRGYLNIAAFYNDFTNQQIQASMITANPALWVGGSATLNAGKSRIWGVEVDASVSPFSGLKLDAGYAYLNTKLQELTVPSIPVEAQSVIGAIVPSAVLGDVLALSPKHRITLNGSYTLPLDESIGQISLGATFTHTSSQVASRATSPRFSPLQATSLLNLNVNWNNVMGKPIDLSFFMTNAGNKAYAMNVSQSWRALGYEAVNMNEPRTWGFRMKYRFGN